MNVNTTSTVAGPVELSMESVLKHDIPGALRFHNDFLITSNLKDAKVFTQPMRLRATSIFICVSGEIECMVNMKRYVVTADHLMIGFSGDVVQVLSYRDVDGYAVILSDEYLKSLQIDFRVRTESFLSLRSNGTIYIPRKELEYLLPYYVLLKKNIADDNADVLRGLSHALSCQMLEFLRRYGREGETPQGGASRAQQIFERFVKLLDAHHERERSLQFYADKMFLTPKYVSGMVKQYTGKGALEWINEYVMLEARMMLTHTDLTVQEISYRLNFPTQSAFGKYFRQQEGVSPRAYRQGKRAGNEGSGKEAKA